MNSNYITSNSSLIEICKKIKKTDIIAIDTEFVRRTTYHPILSLIQVSFDKKVYLIDCLAKGIDISPILKIINSSKVKKVLHSSIQDLQIFYQETKVKPKNIEDTQILANFAGFDLNLSYAKLVDEFFGIQISKKMQQSNWLKRPLSNRQIEYAAIDVIYLEEIYEKLKEEVKERGLLKEYKQDVKYLIGSLNADNLSSLSKVFMKGRRKIFNRKKIPTAKINDLLLWRDKMAKRINVPRRHLVSDDDLQSVILGKRVNLRLNDSMQESLDKILKKSNYRLDLEGKSCKIEFDKNEFELIKKELADIAKEVGVNQGFIISLVDLQSVFYQNKKFNNLTKWRRKIIAKLKKKFK